MLSCVEERELQASCTCIPTVVWQDILDACNVLPLETIRVADSDRINEVD